MNEKRKLSNAASEFLAQNLPANFERFDAENLPRVRRESHEGFAPACKKILDETGASVEELSLNDVAVQRVVPSGGGRDDAAVLYHFGGGFVMGSAYEDSVITAQIATALNVSVYAAKYRLSPEHPFPAAQDDAFAVYRAMVDSFDNRRLAVMGESAGGNLSLSVLNRARGAALPMPSALAVLSPWVAIGDLDGSVSENDGRDPTLGRQYIEDASRFYVADQDYKNPQVSPLFADYDHAFPPTIVTTGTRDLLLSGSVMIAEKLQSAGVDTTLKVWDDLWHVFEFYPDIPEARESIGDIVAHLKTHMRL
ncbi:MAG: alpha/beta hydrolase [Pseudomonadota bacterium]